LVKLLRRGTSATSTEASEEDHGAEVAAALMDYTKKLQGVASNRSRLMQS